MERGRRGLGGGPTEGFADDDSPLSFPQFHSGISVKIIFLIWAYVGPIYSVMNGPMLLFLHIKCLNVLITNS